MGRGDGGLGKQGMRQTSELKSACREQLTNGALVIMPSQLVVMPQREAEQKSAAFTAHPFPSRLAQPTHVCFSVVVVVAAHQTQLAHKTKFQNNLRLAILEDALRNFIEMFGSFSCRAQFVSHKHANTHTYTHTGTQAPTGPLTQLAVLIFALPTFWGM